MNDRLPGIQQLLPFHGRRALVTGAIKTPGTERLIKRALTRVQLRMWGTGCDFQRRFPLKRWGDPDEVAPVILFFSL